MPEFVEYHGREGELSPTAAAVKFFNDLKAVYGDNNVINLGQGAETENPPEELFVSSPSVHGAQYRSQVGGEEMIRELAANWVEVFLGIHATSKNTFVMQKQGREAVREAVTYASSINVSNAAFLSKYHWPMYDAIVKRVRDAKIRLYENPAENVVEHHFVDSLAMDRPFVVITNTPENPTGRIYKQNYMKMLGVYLDALNDVREKYPRGRIVHLLDMPYFYAAPAAYAGHHFTAGYEYATNPDAKTPWIAAISFSKALGMATPGLSFIVTHPAIAEDFRNQLTHGGGLSYDPGFFAKIAPAFQPEKYDIQSAHYANLREKYRINRETLTQRFGSEVVPGAPGMTALMSIPDLFEKTLHVENHAYTIDTTADVIEFLGNTQRVIVVDNGREGNAALIRVAQAQRPASFDPGIDRLHKGIEHIRNG